MDSPHFRIEFGDGPIVAAAIHDGGAVRPEVAKLLRLDERGRRYEEDPFTAAWTVIAPTRIVGLRSRFELDLNRPREKAVYLTSADCWGLDLWNSPPAEGVVNRSLAAYDDFYAQVRFLLEGLLRRHPRVVVFDLHSYNHRRDGRDKPPADPREKPEINLGTRTMDRTFWGPVVDRWLAEMRAFDYLGRQLDVRENVSFFGGNFPGWIHREFPGRVCALAIEVKKFFMDEWTGELDAELHAAIGEALQQAAVAVLDELLEFKSGGTP